ncbi:MAG: D-glycerate dehydrogenase [Solirubrobacterales bacterium]|nr:D-glycerate dehydrogenase [Solirubrobacterales bacterium]
MPSRYFASAFAHLEREHEIRYVELAGATPFVASTPSELRLREYLGSPAPVMERMAGVEVLAVHGAPITDEVLDASPELRLVGCARGGPVNVDRESLRARGLTLVNTPGKNAEAVADLTLAMMVILARQLTASERHVRGGQRVNDNWEGGRFMGADLRDHVLGVIGYGQIGQRVAQRARAFGMAVIVYDPYVTAVDADQAAELEELLGQADFVSLHARASAENENLIDAAALAAMRPGAYLVNTARETLLDEAALDAALASGHLAGAALDVFTPDAPAYLSRHENVVLTPHIGGATHDTLLQGAQMLAEEVARFAAGEPLENVVDAPAVSA